MWPFIDDIHAASPRLDSLPIGIKTNEGERWEEMDAYRVSRESGLVTGAALVSTSRLSLDYGTVR